MTSLRCPGPEGTNLLGFLCALGTVSVLDEAWPRRHVALSWERRVGWRPVLHFDEASGEDDVTTALYDVLRSRAGAAWPRLEHTSGVAIRNLNEIRPAEFREFARAARDATPPDRRRLAFLASLASDVPDAADEPIGDTALRTMSGAGHQHFVESMRRLMEGTTSAQVRSALFAAWRYADERLSMRWDPVDDRRHALRADAPSGSAPRTVHGANRLAVEALPFFPCVPDHRRVATSGFDWHDGSTWAVWPIWTVPATPAVIASLLVHPLVRRVGRDPTDTSTTRLAILGVADVIKSRRFRTDKTINFSPGRSARGR